MLRQFSYEYLPPKLEKSILLELVIVAAEAADHSCPFAQCLADLILIALFLYRQLCKYTNTNSYRWMVQFRFKYMQFHDMEGFIPHNYPAKVFLQSWAVTLFLYT